MSLSNRHRFRVYYADTDMAGIVYYANYLKWFEAGRSELLRARGVSYRALQESGFTVPVATASVRYLAPALYEDELELETIVDAVRHASFKVSYRLTRTGDGALLATGETTHACVDREGRPTRIPEGLRRSLGAEPSIEPDA